MQVGIRANQQAGPPSILSIAKSHTGSFTQGQTGAAYAVTVSNGGAAGPTSGPVTVTEAVPSGLTLVSMAGTGWTCPSGGTTCTRSDVLGAGASYPAITVTVNVGASAQSPQVNSVSVSGGGSAGANATDSTVIVPPAALPVLSIAKSHTGSFTQGQTGAVYAVTVSNGGTAGPTSGVVTVTEAVPSGLTLVSMAGAGWTCPGGGATCTRSDVLAAGASYPAITVTVNVGASAASPQVNSVSVSGGGSAGANATDSTVILALASIALVQPVKVCPNTNTCSFPATPGMGNQVVVLIAVDGYPTSISASDNQGNSYTAFPVTTGTYRSTLKGFIAGAVAATGTFTVTSTDNGTSRSIVMYEYSGLSTTFDGSAHNDGQTESGNTGTCGVLTTSNANDLIVAGVTSSVTNINAYGFSSPFTFDGFVGNSAAAILSGHYIASAASSGLLTNFTWGPGYNIGNYGCMQVGIRANQQAGPQ
jgi:uncharacterized repeat protein (TIGR01451 family)